MKNKKNVLLLVEWGDAWGTSGWKDVDWIEKEHSPIRVHTVGFLVKQDKTGISLSQGYSETGTPLAVSFVPRGMIIKTKRLRY